MNIPCKIISPAGDEGLALCARVRTWITACTGASEEQLLDNPGLIGRVAALVHDGFTVSLRQNATGEWDAQPTDYPAGPPDATTPR